MSSGPIVVTPDERPKALDLGGEDITVLASGAQTGSYEIFLQVGRAGSGPPPHHHPWDEAFYVLRGDVTFGADAEEATVGPGTLVHIPGGTTHWFRLGEGGAEMLWRRCRGAGRQSAAGRRRSPGGRHARVA